MVFKCILECINNKIKKDDKIIKEKLQEVLKDALNREGGTKWAEKQKEKPNICLSCTSCRYYVKKKEKNLMTKKKVVAFASAFLPTFVMSKV